MNNAPTGVARYSDRDLARAAVFLATAVVASGRAGEVREQVVECRKQAKAMAEAMGAKGDSTAEPFAAIYDMLNACEAAKEETQ